MRFPNYLLLVFTVALSSTFLSSCTQDEPEPKKEICGCTEAGALNYNADATCDDGSCLVLDDEKKTLNTLFTSTGCGGCGVWGIDCHTRYSHEMAADAIPFELHFKYGDPMINPTSDSFVAIATPRYSPFFAVGLFESMDLAAENRPKICEKSQERAEGYVATFKKDARPSQVAIAHQVEGNEIKVHFAYKAQDFEGLQYAVYLLENNVVATQNAGWKNDVEGWEHQNVVRKAITPVLGRKMTSDQKMNTLTVPIEEGWNKDELYAAIVLWEPNGPYLPKVVNAEDSME